MPCHAPCRWPPQEDTKAISHIALVVRDTARTAQLFEPVLGARIVKLKHERQGPPETYFSLGGVWFVLMKGEPPAVRTDDHVAFAVAENDLDSYAERLRRLGIESQMARAGTPAKSLYFVDYDPPVRIAHGAAGTRAGERPF